MLHDLLPIAKRLFLTAALVTNEQTFCTVDTAYVQLAQKLIFLMEVVMKRLMLILCFGILAEMLLCSGATAKTTKIDVNSTMKPGGSEEAAIMKFKEVVEQKSGGRMKVRPFMSGQLGKENAILELMKIGQTQMALTGGLWRINLAPEYDVAKIPFYLSNWEVVKDYLEGPFGKKIDELGPKGAA